MATAGHIWARQSRRQSRRGMALLYTGLLVVALLGIVSLAVDYGRVQLVKAELHVAADAAARYAAPGIADGTTLSRAQAAAADNTAAGAPVVLTAADVAVGRWDSGARSFTAGGTPANAVQVTARRTAARGNPVPLVFGALVGVGPRDVRAIAVVTYTPTSLPYGIVGLSDVSLQGDVFIDSYNSGVAAYSAGWSPDRGNVVSNGDIELIGSIEVRGDVRPGPGETATGGTVTGVRTPQSSPLSVAPVSPGAYGPTNNDNANIPPAYRPGSDFSYGNNGTLTVPAGTYYFRHFNLGGNAVLNVTGNVTIYVTGNLTVQGGTGVHRPQQLRFRGIGSGTFDFPGNQNIYAVVEAPTKDVTVGGTKAFFGSILGDTVSVNGTVDIHFDESLIGGGSGASTGALTQVR